MYKIPAGAVSVGVHQETYGLAFQIHALVIDRLALRGVLAQIPGTDGLCTSADYRAALEAVCSDLPFVSAHLTETKRQKAEIKRLADHQSAANARSLALRKGEPT